jgi:tRNA (cmo5U34)-methyltransferase
VKPDNTTAHSAETYDREIAQTIPFYETIHAETLGLVHAAHPDVRLWLDTGCGTGRLVERALPAFPTTRFVLADPSEAMLARARERLVGQERATLLPAAGTADLTPRLARRPDVITAVLAHHYLDVPARQQAVRVCHDLLAEGGLFVTVEIIEPATKEGIHLGLVRWRRFQLDHGRSAEAVEAHIARYGTKVLPISLEAHIALLRGAGFRVVEPFWLSVMQAGFYALR